MRFIDTSFNRNVQDLVDEECQLEITLLGNDPSINSNDYRGAARFIAFSRRFFARKSRGSIAVQDTNCQIQTYKLNNLFGSVAKQI